MTSSPQRDPVADHLITPQNAVLLLIDYQPTQVSKVRSIDQGLLVQNIVSTVRTVPESRTGRVQPAAGPTWASQSK